MSKAQTQTLVVFAAAVWVLAAAMVGCAHHKSAPPPITGPNLNPIDAGRSIYTSACHSCHGTPPIGNYSLSNWTNSIIPSMAPRAGLGATDQQNLVAYVTSVKNAGGP